MQTPPTPPALSSPPPATPAQGGWRDRPIQGKAALNLLIPETTCSLTDTSTAKTMVRVRLPSCKISRKLTRKGMSRRGGQDPGEAAGPGATGQAAEVPGRPTHPAGSSQDRCGHTHLYPSWRRPWTQRWAAGWRAGALPQEAPGPLEGLTPRAGPTRQWRQPESSLLREPKCGSVLLPKGRRTQDQGPFGHSGCTPRGRPSLYTDL